MSRCSCVDGLWAKRASISRLEFQVGMILYILMDRQLALSHGTSSGELVYKRKIARQGLHTLELHSTL
jgi:hypothetical protein